MRLILTATMLAFFAVATTATAQQTLRPVKLIKLAEESGTLSRQFFGKVVARQTVDLAFQVSGQIREFPIVEGAALSKGDLIARLDLEIFELSLEQARLQKEQAVRTLERLTKLTGSTVSQVTIDDAQTAEKLAEVAVQNAEYALRHATLTAPFDGIVAARDVANFTTVAAGTPVLRLHDLSEIRVEIDVPEVLFRRAGADPDVSITATFPGRPEIYPLNIREFNAETSTVGQTFRLTLGMDPPKDLRILPGSSVTVTARLMGGPSAIFVPSTALVFDTDAKANVMVFTPTDADEGKVTKTPVEILASPDGRFMINSGLAAGAEIVGAGAASLADGQSVRRFTGFAN